jgi:hypothetical protein
MLPIFGLVAPEWRQRAPSMSGLRSAKFSRAGPARRRAIDQFGQIIDVFVASQRDANCGSPVFER